MIGVRARLSFRQEGESLKLIFRPVSPLIFALIAALLAGAYLVGGLSREGAAAENMGYLLLLIFVVGAASFSQVTRLNPTARRVERYSRLFGMALPLGRRSYPLEQLRSVILEQINIVNPRLSRTQERWEHDTLKKPVDIHRLSLQFPRERLVVAETSVAADLEQSAELCAAHTGATLERRER
jgi:hypothetical protein